MSKQPAFPGIEPIRYQPDAPANALAFRYYDKDRLVLGKTVADSPDAWCALREANDSKKSEDHTEVEALRADLEARKSLIKSLRSDQERIAPLQANLQEKQEIIAQLEAAMNRHSNTIAELRRIWDIYQPQMADYLTRALNPTAAPSYRVPGDP